MLYEYTTTISLEHRKNSICLPQFHYNNCANVFAKVLTLYKIEICKYLPTSNALPYHYEIELGAHLRSTFSNMWKGRNIAGRI